MSRGFSADQWLDRWSFVGGVTIAAGRVELTFNLDGNGTEPRALLGRLDGKPDRRAAVRTAALARWRA